jgi:hypothetical protein
MDTSAPPSVQHDVSIIGDNNTVIVAGRDAFVDTRVSGRGGERRRGGSRRWPGAGVLTFFITSATLVTLAIRPQLSPSSFDWPEGKSALCRDGSYSPSHHRAGTCSGHGGVAAWRYAADHSYWNR